MVQYPDTLAYSVFIIIITTTTPIDNGRWEEKAIESGTRGRAGHASCALGKYMFVMGGYDGVKRLSDVQMFDVEKQSWSIPHISGTPPNGYPSFSSYSLLATN